MRITVRFTLIAFAVVVLAAPAFAQTNASLSGEVTTEGVPLPGVTITIASPNLQGTRVTVSSDTGAYYFGAIPPGRYDVKFELDGMQTVTSMVELGVSQAGRTNAEMVAVMAESIIVTASAPAVLETSQVTSNFEAELIEELPVARTIFGAALLAPGVNDNTYNANQFSISGSPGYDNLVMVNGVVTTEAVRSQDLTLYIEDAIQETTVITGAISAEYGRFTGGVVNAITKSGGNEFSGSFRDSISNPSWTNKTPWPNQPDPVDENNYVYEATFGGRILRDRLWFFAAGRQTEQTSEAFTRPVPGDDTNTIFKATNVTSSDKYEGKLTAQITPKHSLVASYFEEDATRTASRFTPASYDLEQFTGRSDPKNLMTASYNGILTTNFLVEARYSEMEYGIGHGSGSQYTDFIRGTIVLNRGDSNARFNSPTFCGVCDKEWRNNDSWILKGNYFLSTPGWGNHNLVAGAESFSEQRYSNNYQSGSNFRVLVNSVQRVNGSETLYPTLIPGPGGSATYIQWTPIFQLTNFTDWQTDSLFINDKWDLNSNWSFNVGLRYDKNDSVDSSGTKVSDDKRISPRFTAIYDIRGDGRYRITASMNEYVSRIADTIGGSSSAGGNPSSIHFAYLGPEINPPGTPVDQLIDTHTALQMVWDWFQSQGGTDNLDLLRVGGSRSVSGYDTLISDTLGSPFVREYALGFGWQIGANAYVKLDAISRDWEDFYAARVDSTTPTKTDPLGIEHDVEVWENTNLATREYRGIQLQSAWRPNRFNFGLNYTYSTLEGNDVQESSGSAVVGNAPGEIYYPELLNYERRRPIGDLTQDQRHRLRAWVGYDVPMPPVFGNLNLSLLHRFDSGLPYEAVGSILVQGAGTGAPTDLSYVSAPGTGTYYFSERGAYRLPDINATDIAVNYGIPIWKIELFAQAEMLNVFDNDDVVSVNTSVNARGNNSRFAAFNPFTTNPNDLIECPQGTATTACQAMGAHWQKGTNFGKPTGPASYQNPREYRFSVGVRF